MSRNAKIEAVRSFPLRATLILLFIIVVLFASGVGNIAAQGITESFGNITTLTSAGWVRQNNSSPSGSTNWFQGDESVFPAHTGTMPEYIAADYRNTSGTGTISNWLLTPNRTFKNGDIVKFWTRTSSGSDHPDRLEVRLSANGASTNAGSNATDVGDFTTLLLSINENLTIGGYPTAWTQYTISLSGLPAGGASGRVAFRYFVTTGGPGGANSNFIGIDTFSYSPIADVPADFDGDGKTDLSVHRSPGSWWALKSSDGGTIATAFGNSSDKIAPGDYTGDGKTDFTFFRPSSGTWFVMRSEDNSFYSFPFGVNGDIPAPADFDGDAKTDAAIFRPSNSTWYVRRSSDGVTIIQQFGASGDVPVVADYDGDGRADIAIYRVSQGEWWINRSSNATTVAYQFGTPTDKPVQGDYTGDSKSDVAFFRPVSGEWFVLRSENLSFYSFPFGASGDVPAPGDYDGDEKFDAAVFRPSTSVWYAQRTTAGTLIQQFGQNGDRPVPNAFVP